MTQTRSLRLLPLFGLLLIWGCPKQDKGDQNSTPKPATPAAETAAAPAPTTAPKIGLVTDVGGRGDQSFNDGALRGLELWAGGKRFATGGYQEASKEDIQKTLTPDLASRQPPIAPVNIQPVVLQSKAQEDYEPNLQLLVDQGAKLAVGVGFLMESAVKTVAQRNPTAKFLLIDSLLHDAQGNTLNLPNVRTVVFREEQGSFLVGALAGLVTKTNQVGFVGGMEVPLIKKFEAGFRAGVMTTNPKAQVLANYTGSFDNVATGKQVGQDLATKGADVVFQAAGADGLGVIQAVKEARTAGKQVYVIGVDSDQSHLAPEAVLTSMLKRVDLAVYEAARDVAAGTFKADNIAMGLKEGGVTYAEVRVDFPGKAEALKKVEALRQKVVAGDIKVPSTSQELSTFKPTP